jgi:hypothetical protein
MKCFKRRCLLISAFLLALIPHMVAAVPAWREEEFARYGIKFYDPSDSENAGGMFCGGFGMSDSGLAGNTTVQKMANFLMQHGFTPEQAAGIIGNAMQESRLWPLAMNTSSNNFWGLFQWSITFQGSPGREAGLRQKMIAAGLGEYISTNSGYWSPNSEASRAIPPEVLDEIIRIQLEYAVIDEAGSFNWVQRVKATNTVEEATEAFLFYFLRAVGGAEIESNRMSFYAPAIGLYYQEVRERINFAREVAGQASGTCGLVAGGMTLEQAELWLQATGYLDLSNDIHSRFQLPG